MNTEKTKGTGSSRTPFIRQLIRLTESAVLVALAIGLSYLELDIGLQGGSLSLVMIPLVILALRHGAGWGVGAGLVFGVIKCALGGGFAWGLASVLLDYVLAYGIIGVVGFFRVKSAGMAACAAVVAGVLRFVIHFISGVTIYKLMEATTLYGIEFSAGGMGSVIAYSIVYNGVYMLPNIIVTAIAVAILQKYLPKTVADI